MASSLIPSVCSPCVGKEGSTLKPLTDEEIARLVEELGGGWTIVRDAVTGVRELELVHVAKNFVDALALVNRVGAIAEEMGHHPDLHLTGWKHVRICLSTHALSSLSLNDFVVAKRISAAGLSSAA